MQNRSYVSDIDAYLAAVVQYYTSADRPYSDRGFPSLAFDNLSVEHVLAPAARTFLFGPPGSGKTTFLDWAALRAASSRQAVPIFISLRNYTSNLNDLLRVSVERFSPHEPTSREGSQGTTDPGPAFLIDALDEVSPAFRPKVEDEIVELAGAWSTAPIVITGRIAPSVTRWLGWSIVAMPSLSDEQVDSYLRDTPRGEILRRALLENPQLREMAKRPLLLHTIRNAWMHGEDLRTYLMREIPRYVAWRGHTKSRLSSSVSPELIDELLSLVALDLAIRGAHTLDVGRLRHLAGQLIQEETTITRLTEAAQATDVLATAGESVSFVHLTLLESYAARALASRMSRPGAFEPLFISVLSGRFGAAVGNHFVSLISDSEMTNLRELLSAESLAALVGMTRDSFADRTVARPGLAPNDPKRIGQVAASVAQFSDRQELARRDILVIAVHGFNTRGDWINRLGLVLTRATDGERFLDGAWDYGDFRLGIVNPLARRRLVKRFQEFFNDLLGSFPVRPEVVVVAHSLGAYIVAHATRRFPEVCFDRTLLLGAALPRTFDWTYSIARCGRVLNLIGGADSALTLARLVPGLGAAGKDGFLATDDRLIQVTEAHSDHGDLFGTEYMRDVWIPFMRDGTVPHGLHGRPTRAW